MVQYSSSRNYDGELEIDVQLIEEFGSDGKEKIISCFDGTPAHIFEGATRGSRFGMIETTAEKVFDFSNDQVYAISYDFTGLGYGRTNPESKAKTEFNYKNNQFISAKIETDDGIEEILSNKAFQERLQAGQISTKIKKVLGTEVKPQINQEVQDRYNDAVRFQLKSYAERVDAYRRLEEANKDYNECLKTIKNALDDNSSNIYRKNGQNFYEEYDSDDKLLRRIAYKYSKDEIEITMVEEKCPDGKKKIMYCFDGAPYHILDGATKEKYCGDVRTEAEKGYYFSENGQLNEIEFGYTGIGYNGTRDFEEKADTKFVYKDDKFISVQQGTNHGMESKSIGKEYLYDGDGRLRVYNEDADVTPHFVQSPTKQFIYDGNGKVKVRLNFANCKKHWTTNVN